MDSLSNLPSPFGPPTHWDRILHITPSQSPIRLASTDSPYENSVGILSDLSIGEAAHLEEINQQMILLDEKNEYPLPDTIEIDPLGSPAASQKSIKLVKSVGNSNSECSSNRRSFLVSFEPRPLDSKVEAERKKLYDSMNEERLREELLTLNRKLDDMEALLKASLIHNLKQMS